MTTTREIEPLPHDDDAIRTALEDAHLPSLLPALAQITGDRSLLREDLFPDTVTLAAEQGGLSPEAQAAARELALETLAKWRDSGSVVAPPPSLAEVRGMMDFLIGDHVSDDYLPLLLEELAFADADARAPEWNKDAIDAGRDMRVVVIGAGMSGILAAHRLKQAGVDYTVVEKNGDVGGTWFENTYPGARVDSSNHAYSYSFAQKFDWPYHHSTQEVLLEYFRDCADLFGVREDIRFNTEVLSVTYDDERCLWAVRVRGPEGGEETIEAEAVISAVGQLNRPKMPDIAGLGSFEGLAFHSAQWDHSIDFAGKSVGVIGTGSSASQFIPHLADDAAEVRIFQRTPNWYAPAPNYHERVAEGFLWLLKHVPTYAQWYRFWLFWAISDGFLPMVEVDDNWQPGDEVTGEGNRQLRDLLAGSLRKQLEGRPDLIEKALPNFPPASKRIVVDNGSWPNTLMREHVHLITEPISQVTPRGILTEDGEEARARRAGLRDRLPGLEVPHAGEGRGARRGRYARAVGRRRARLPGHHDSELPQLLLPVRAEHEHRGERQHRVLLGVRGAVRAGVPEVPAGERAAGDRLPHGRARCLQRTHRRGQPEAGVGRFERAELVQERVGAGGAELAVHAAGVLAADEADGPRRLRAALGLHSLGGHRLAEYLGASDKVVVVAGHDPDAEVDGFHVCEAARGEGKRGLTADGVVAELGGIELPGDALDRLAAGIKQGEVEARQEAQVDELVGLGGEVEVVIEGNGDLGLGDGLDLHVPDARLGDVGGGLRGLLLPPGGGGGSSSGGGGGGGGRGRGVGRGSLVRGRTAAAAGEREGNGEHGQQPEGTAAARVRRHQSRGGRPPRATSSMRTPRSSVT